MPEETAPLVPEDPRQLRCSDADREAVAELLRVAAGDGRLTLDELSERLDQAYAARTYADLEPVLVDLPGSQQSAVPALARPASVAARPGSSLDRVGGTAGSSTAIAIFSGSTFKGEWVVPPTFTAFALFGGVDLDLRDAHYQSREVTIQASAIFGGIDIIVPDDVVVHVNGAGVFGGFDGPREQASSPDSVVIRVTGVAIFGGVDVKRKPRREPKDRRALRG